MLRYFPLSVDVEEILDTGLCQPAVARVTDRVFSFFSCAEDANHQTFAVWLGRRTPNAWSQSMPSQLSLSCVYPLTPTIYKPGGGTNNCCRLTILRTFVRIRRHNRLPCRRQLADEGDSSRF